MNGDLMDRFVADLKLKSYQKRSVQSYLRAVRQLQNFTCKAVEDITEEEVREYWLYCKEELGWGSATLRISYSGIKLFYSLTLKRDWEVLRSVKFERDQTLRVVVHRRGALDSGRDSHVAEPGVFHRDVRLRIAAGGSDSSASARY